MPSHHHNVDIDPLDLSEAPRLPKDSAPRGVMLGGALLVALFIALLIYGSLPELSPTEIVAMDGYAGERPTKHIFNLQSLEAEKQKATEKKATEMAAIANAPETVKPAAVTSTTELPIAKTEAIVPKAIVTEVVVAPVVKPVEPVVQQAEVELKTVDEPIVVAIRDEPLPVLLDSIRAKEKVVAAVPTTPAVEEASTTVVVRSIVADEPAPMPIRRGTAELAGVTASSSASSETARLLPLRRVLKDFTEVKQEPTVQSKTLMSLGQGVEVTAFERRGSWIYIGTNDGSSITGYVLESAIGRIER